MFIPIFFEFKIDAIGVSALQNKFAKPGRNLIYSARISSRLFKCIHLSFDVTVVPRLHLLYDNCGEEWIPWHIRAD